MLCSRMVQGAAYNGIIIHSGNDIKKRIKEKKTSQRLLNQSQMLRTYSIAMNLTNVEEM